MVNFLTHLSKHNLELKSNGIIIGLIVAVFVVLLYPSNASALIQTPEENVTVTPINEKISLEKTVTTMEIPNDTALSWGTVKGAPSTYAERYPVIIQFFKEDEPVHVAQVKVKGDGSYEYKFRVRNVDKSTGEILNIFEGKYTVKIFRVIPNSNKAT